MWNIFWKCPPSGESIHLMILSPQSRFLPRVRTNLYHDICLMFFTKLHIAPINFSTSKRLCTLVEQYMAKLLPACLCTIEWKSKIWERNHVRGKALCEHKEVVLFAYLIQIILPFVN